MTNKKHLKNVGPIRYCELPLHCQSPGVASRTPAIAIAQAACDVHNDHNDNDNAWQRGPLWPHGMGPKSLSSPIDMYTHAGSEFDNRVTLIFDPLTYHALPSLVLIAEAFFLLERRHTHSRGRRRNWWFYRRFGGVGDDVIVTVELGLILCLKVSWSQRHSRCAGS